MNVFLPSPPLRRRRRPRFLGLLLCLLPMLPLAMLLGPDVAAGDAVTVSQRHRTFAPNVLHVRVGAVVHIVNDDNVTHHVYLDQSDMHFDSGEQPIGDTVDLHFNQRGDFDVQCAIHPTMHLDVIVR